MSGLMAQFATAPRLKLYIYDQPVAYAIGFNISVSVDVQPVYVIGKYAPVSLEPTMYNIVTGTMQIVRLVSAAAQGKQNTNAALQPALTDQTGKRATATFDTNSEIVGTDPISTNTPLQQKELFRHLDPEQLLLSQSFNIRVFMKVPKISAGNFVTTKPLLEEKEWMEVQTCRVTSRNTNITMGQLVNEPISFQGLLALNKTGTQFSLDSATGQATVSDAT
jgi:hypothetical protein